MIQIEEIGLYIKFECLISNSTLVFMLEKLEGDIYNVKIFDIDINWSMPKLFINLIKYSIDNLQTKYEINNLIHTVCKDEWEFLKNNNYIIVKEYEIDGNTYIDIACDIKIALENIVINLFRDNPL